MMMNRSARVVWGFFAFVGCYAVLFLPTAMAVSEQLNLDTNLEPQVAPMPSMFGLFLRLLISLILISGLAFLTMKFLRRNMQVLSRGVNIKVLDQYAFSMNKGVYITQIADKVYVLGVTDQSINCITVIEDQDIINEMVALAKQREMEPIIPSSILERILPSALTRSTAGGKPFSTHFQNQIKKLQSIVENRAGNSREEDKK